MPHSLNNRCSPESQKCLIPSTIGVLPSLKNIVENTYCWKHLLYNRCSPESQKCLIPLILRPSSQFSNFLCPGPFLCGIWPHKSGSDSPKKSGSAKKIKKNTDLRVAQKATIRSLSLNLWQQAAARNRKLPKFLCISNCSALCKDLNLFWHRIQAKFLSYIHKHIPPTCAYKLIHIHVRTLHIHAYLVQRGNRTFPGLLLDGMGIMQQIGRPKGFS